MYEHHINIQVKVGAREKAHKEVSVMCFNKCNISTKLHNLLSIRSEYTSVCVYLPVKCRCEKRCWMKCVSAEKSRSCSLSTLMRTAALTCSRPLRSEQNDSTSPAGRTDDREGCSAGFWTFILLQLNVMPNRKGGGGGSELPVHCNNIKHLSA